MNIPDSEKNQFILINGKVKLKGQFTFGSNYTFLVDVTHEGQTVQGVYKPSRGEQPLWDFPESTLALREVAAYLVSEALGFGFVPFTVLRDDGPHGAGSLQQYIQYDSQYHYFNFSETEKSMLMPVALFDLLINNADRKGGHVFFEEGISSPLGTRKLFAIDHGICFHEQSKLRTVIWDFAGQKIPADLLTRLDLRPNLLADLEPYLSPSEIGALRQRAERIRKRGTFPVQPSDRRAIPWPPL